MANFLSLRTALRISSCLLLLLSLSFCFLLYLMNVSGYLITLAGLFIVPLCVLLTSTIKANYSNQSRNIAILLEALVDEDYSMRSAINSQNDEMLEIKLLLNTLSTRLAQQSVAIKESQLLLEKVISHIDVAIIASNEHYDITFTNPAANDLLDISTTSVGLNLTHTSIPVTKITTQPQSFTINVGGISKTYRISTVKYIHEQQLNYLFFISDVQWLLIDKERDSWQRLHRVLSHEVNNSLTPITSISATLLKLVTKPEVSMINLEQGLNVIHSRSASLNTFISNFQRISKLPPPTKVPFCLTELIQKCVLLFPHTQIDIVNPEVHHVFADPQQLEQVLVNLLKNAKEAMAQTTGKITVAIQTSDKYTSIHITDEGTGIINTDNLFIPFFSTKSKGSGIGLVFSRQILFNHLGDLQIKNRKDRKGTIATVSLPRVK